MSFITTLRYAFLAALFVLPLAGQDTAATQSAPPAADRAAILAMAGGFAVDFRFEETISFQPGYTLTKPYHEDAKELVVVAEDSPQRIALQHLLLVGAGRVIQHWRQVWTYEDTRLTEFQGHNTCRTRLLAPAEARGTWTQMVTNVDNSPRYEGIGRWTHDHGVSSWIAAETWRPLPRREYTKRDDYDVVVGPYRHTIIPTGWVHEQTNAKLDLAEPASRLIARELGLNHYVRTQADFAAAQAWWAENSGFSNALFAAWSEVTQSRESYAIADNVDTAKLRSELSRLAETKPAADGRDGQIREIIARFLRDARKPKVAVTQ
jgi:hypothetical protein